MKSILIAFLGVCLLVSAGANILLFMKHGIHIHNDNRVDQRQWQNQSQSQLIISMLAVQGSIKWKELKIKKDNLIKHLENLEPYQSLFCRIICDTYSTYITVLYPEIFENKKLSKKWKIKSK